MKKEVINSKLIKFIFITTLSIVVALFAVGCNSETSNKSEINNDTSSFGDRDVSHTVKLDKKRFDWIGFYNIKDPEISFVVEANRNMVMIQNDLLYTTNDKNVLFVYDLVKKELLNEIPITGTKGVLTNRTSKLVYDNKYYIFINQQEEYIDRILYILDMETGEIVFEKACWDLDLDAFGIYENHLLFNVLGENFYVMDLDSLEIVFEDIKIVSDDLKSLDITRTDNYIFENKLYRFDHKNNSHQILDLSTFDFTEVAGKYKDILKQAFIDSDVPIVELPWLYKLIYISQAYDRIDVRDLNDVYYLYYEGSRDESTLWVYDIESQDLVWSLECDDYITNAAFTDKHVIVHHQTYLTLHDVDTGKLISTIDIANNGSFSINIAIKDDYIIVLTGLEDLLMIKEK